LPTGRGWLVTTLGVGIGIAGRMFGAQTLVQLGYALIVIVLIAVLVVRMGRHELEVTRDLSPQRVRPGESVRATITIKNTGKGSAPLLLLEDQVPKGMTGRARFAVHGIERGGHRETGYELRAHRRGLFEVGPLFISMVDPFGLARLTSRSHATTSFIVHPRIEVLSLPRNPGDRRSVSASTSRNPTGMRGEDFYTLREYVEGDDLRKIHWGSTAKRNRYMIKQEETPWHTRATIVLDDRLGAHEGAGASSSFDRAVEAAASLVDLYHRAGYGYRLLGAVNAGTPIGRGSEHRNRCLDFLALVQPTRPKTAEDPLPMRLAGLDSRSASEAALLIVTGTFSPTDAAAAGLAARRFRHATVLCYPGHRFSARPTKERWDAERSLVEAMKILGRAGVAVAALGPDESIAQGWNSLWSKSAGTKETPWDQRPELV
jgi:uncharacterized repeat protein (TIGR01451 family)